MQFHSYTPSIKLKNKTLPDLTNTKVVLAALVSAREPNSTDILEPLASRARSLGALVVGTIVQRRGVSRGGVASMKRPLSASTLLGAGKAAELAVLCRESTATVVIFLNTLSGTQVRSLEELTHCRVLGADSLGIN